MLASIVVKVFVFNYFVKYLANTYNDMTMRLFGKYKKKCYGSLPGLT